MANSQISDPTLFPNLSRKSRLPSKSHTQPRNYPRKTVSVARQSHCLRSIQLPFKTFFPSVTSKQTPIAIFAFNRGTHFLSLEFDRVRSSFDGFAHSLHVREACLRSDQQPSAIAITPKTKPSSIVAHTSTPSYEDPSLRSATLQNWRSSSLRANQSQIAINADGSSTRDTIHPLRSRNASDPLL